MTTAAVILLAAYATLPALSGSATNQNELLSSIASETLKDGETRISDLTATEMFAIAEAALAESRQSDAAIILKSLTNDPDIEIRSEARFRLAMLYLSRERPQDAAILLRKILDEKPDEPRVRLELVRALALMGNENAARRELRQVQSGGLPPRIARVINQFSGALRSRKALGASIEIGLAADSNINRATDAATLDTVIAPLQLSDDARVRSGTGVKIGTQVFARKPILPKLNLLIRASGSAKLYQANDFNDISASVLGGVEYRSGRTRLRPAVGRTWRWYGGENYSRTDLATVNLVRGAGPRSQITADLTIGNSSYVQNFLQNGILYSASLSYDRAFSNRDGGSISVTAQRQDARDQGYATSSGALNLLYWREVGQTAFPATIYVTASVRRLEADERLLLFPERRQDWFVGGTIGGNIRALSVAGFSPIVRLRYERSISTVELYDYSRTSVEFGLRRPF